MFVVKLNRRDMHPIYLGFMTGTFTTDINQALRFENEWRAIRHIAGLSHDLKCKHILFAQQALKLPVREKIVEVYED